MLIFILCTLVYLLLGFGLYKIHNHTDDLPDFGLPGTLVAWPLLLLSAAISL